MPNIYQHHELRNGNFSNYNSGQENKPDAHRTLSNKIAGHELLQITNRCQQINLRSYFHARRTIPVTLVYGFKGVRNLRDDALTAKFTIDLINRTLRISHHNLSAILIKQVQEGIKVNGRRAGKFSQLTGIDRETTGLLLQSWATSLRNHYRFISVQTVLQKKSLKYDLSDKRNIKYLAMKNLSVDTKVGAYILADMAVIFKAFINHGDIVGFTTLQSYDTPVIHCASCIINNIFFRRTSKLALLWAHENIIPVKFDVNFNHQQARRKVRYVYRPITYSEFCFYKKNGFDNVTECPVITKQSFFSLSCLRTRTMIEPGHW